VIFEHLDLAVDTLQMTGVLIIAVVQVYIVIRLERTIHVASTSLS
jgi:hypothetical protein